MDDLKRCYELLGLAPGASAGEVRHRFRELVARCHPDRFAGDPARQRQAEEQLRLVIEAHRRIASPVGGEGSSQSWMGGGAGGRNVTWPKFAPFRPAVGAAPNMLFMATIGICTVVAAGRFGATLRGIGALLELIIVPFLFSVVWNLTERRPGALRRTYLGFTVAAAVVAVVEVTLAPSGGGGGGASDGPAAVESGGEPGGMEPAGGAPFSGTAVVPEEGSPLSAARRAPLAPLAPVAPAAPAVPLAPAAPVVPPLRR